MGEAFGMPTGRATVGQLVAALRSLGSDYVFDTTFSADLTIMEEGTELLQRLNAGDLRTSRCSPRAAPAGFVFSKASTRNDRTPVYGEVSAADVRRGGKELAGSSPGH